MKPSATPAQDTPVIFGRTVTIPHRRLVPTARFCSCVDILIFWWVHRRTCREKDELANAKLQQMVSGQNEAERRKGEAEILSKDLQQQNDRIAERRHQVRDIEYSFVLAIRASFEPYEHTGWGALHSMERRQSS